MRHNTKGYESLQRKQPGPILATMKRVNVREFAQIIQAKLDPSSEQMIIGFRPYRSDSAPRIGPLMNWRNENSDPICTGLS